MSELPPITAEHLRQTAAAICVGLPSDELECHPAYRAAERIEQLEEELQAANDYAENRAGMLDLVREKLEVPVEPHQSLDERLLIVLTSPLNSWSLLSTPENEDEQRAMFERWYARIWSEDSGVHHTADEVKKLRKPNGFYGDRGYLNGCWVGFKGSRGCQF